MTPPMTAVSLFAGIGGFDEALRRAGANVVAAVEIDPACRGVLGRHFPDTNLFSDVTEVTGDLLVAAGFVPGHGIITAGWPCQGNSQAGRRKGMADPRSGMWVHVARLLAELRPRWFLGENVPGLLSVNGGADMRQVLNDLNDLRYVVNLDILDAQYFGLPQRRRRLFFACQQANHILTAKTRSSSLIIAKCLTEILACILVVARQQSLTAYRSSVSSSGLSGDGLRKKMRLFGLDAGPTSWRMCLETLADASAKSQLALPDSESASESDVNSLKVAMSSLGTVPTGVPSWNTGLRWNSIWAEVCETASWCTTSTPSSVITESRIFSCARVLLTINEHIARLMDSSPNYFDAASSASTALKEYMSYARQSINSLFGDMAWADRWLAFLRQAEHPVLIAGCLGDGATPIQVLFEPESGGGDHPARSEARPGTARSAADGTGVSGRKRVSAALTATYGNGTSGDLGVTGTVVAATLQGGGHRGHRVDAEGAAGGHLVAAEITGTLRSHPRPGSADPGNITVAPFPSRAVPHALTAREGKGADSDATSGIVVVPVALRGRGGGSQAEAGSENDPAFTVRTGGGGSSVPMVAHTLTGEGADASEDGTGRGTPLVAVPVQDGRDREKGQNGLGVGDLGDPAYTVDTTGSGSVAAFNWQAGGSQDHLGYGETPGALHASQTPAVHLNGGGGVSAGVRRLTPLECERLQGLPGEWTQYLADGTEQSDSARYRQIGNAVALPVAQWIAERIVMVEGQASESS